LEQLAKSELTGRENKKSPHLFQVHAEMESGDRLIYSAGENPYYVASLWRSDELDGKE